MAFRPAEDEYLDTPRPGARGNHCAGSTDISRHEPILSGLVE